MDKFTTLIFVNNTADELSRVREISKDSLCRAWSLDHEILRLELVEKALDENDIEQAKRYLSESDIVKHLHELSEDDEEIPQFEGTMNALNDLTIIKD